MNLNNYIRDVQDFPKEGILFKDISPLLSNPEAFKFTVDKMAEDIKWADAIVGLDARGFIFWSALSYKLGIPFIPVRKPGKLPYETKSIDYDLEYWSNTLEIHTDAVKKWDNVVIVDDLLATGWTAAATIELVEWLWANVLSCHFVIHLEFLKWEEKLNNDNIYSLLKY